ncbi:hypothetical protein QOZ80_5AG0371780 [Eleusine coracana subsp. coracana]|nr:hypothetical protein QOZ80_5AG0371780 [Eleusine coracana subsp. coracana]
MGNCATKPKTKGHDEAPPPAEGERKDEEVAAPEEAQEPVEATRDVVVAPQSEEATTAATAEIKEPDEAKEVPDADADHGKEKEKAVSEAELPASTLEKVA